MGIGRTESVRRRSVFNGVQRNNTVVSFVRSFLEHPYDASPLIRLYVKGIDLHLRQIAIGERLDDKDDFVARRDAQVRPRALDNIDGFAGRPS